MNHERKLHALQIQVGEMFKPALELVHKIASAELTRVLTDAQHTQDVEELVFLTALSQDYSQLLKAVNHTMKNFT